MKRPVSYRKWSPTANDLETANDPQNEPQMILDRVTDPQSRPQMIRNGMDFLGLSAKKDWLEKGKEDARSQANLYKAKKKNGINLKRGINRTRLLPLSIASNFFQEGFVAIKI